jgi:chloramphenicol 3-O phosphotransferase
MWLSDLVELLTGLDVFFVGIHCPLPELERRERERGNQRVGEARQDYQVTHSFTEYDLEIDSMQPNHINVSTLVDTWQSRQSPSAFERLAARK